MIAKLLKADLVARRTSVPEGGIRVALAHMNYVDGWTPLHAACLKGSLPSVQALLDVRPPPTIAI